MVQISEYEFGWRNLGRETLVDKLYWKELKEFKKMYKNISWYECHLCVQGDESQVDLHLFGFPRFHYRYHPLSIASLKLEDQNELKWGDIQLSWEQFWEMIKTPIWGREGGGRRNVLTFPVFLIKTRRRPLGDVYEGIHYIMLLLEQTQKILWGKFLQQKR